MNARIQKAIDKRHETNVKILTLLRKYFDTYPEMRFGQALANLNIIEYDDSQQHHIKDPFFEESIEILEKVKKSYKAQINESQYGDTE